MRPDTTVHPSQPSAGEEEIAAMKECEVPRMNPAVREKGPAGISGIVFPEIQRAPLESGHENRGDPERNIEHLKDVSLRVRVELGRVKMQLRDVLRLVEGSAVELDKLAGDPLDIFVNDRLVGRGELLVLNGDFSVRITQVFSPEECLKIKGIS